VWLAQSGPQQPLNRSGRCHIHHARNGRPPREPFGPPGESDNGRSVSYKATGWAYDLPLRGPAKPVLVALADFADEAGSCYPGQDRLCQMTGLSIRTVRRALERLEALD
jgi:hypothetical protein